MELELSGLAVVDSVGLGVLVGGLKRYRCAEGDLVLRRPPEQVRRVLEVTGIDRIFGLEDGMESFGGSQG